MDGKILNQTSLLIPRINQEKSLSKEGGGVSVPRKRFSLGNRIAVVVLVLVFGLLLTGFFFYRVLTRAKRLREDLTKVQQAFVEKDLTKVKIELSNAKESLNTLQSAYRLVGWLKYTPFFGVYFSDVEHAINVGVRGFNAATLFIQAIEPYAHLIGFKTEFQNSQVKEQTTQQAIDFIIESIPSIVSKAEELSYEVKLMKEEIDYIDPGRYPQKIFNIPLKEKIKRIKSFVDLSSDFIINGKPLLEVSPYLLGLEGERKYLVVFQNDKELRPTGGFITAYTIAKVDKGRFESVVANDIYNLDRLYKPKVEAPEPLRKYIKGPYLISKNYRLRDMNWSPDFFESMKLFVKEVEDAGIKDIDGVIAVDTHLLVNLLDVLGEIQVPGYGGYSNNIVEVCNCPQVVYELENFADLEGPIVWSENEPGKIVYAPPGYFERVDNRKKIIGPMMNTIISNLLNLPVSKTPYLFEAVSKSVFEKHILLFMLDPKVQQAVESFGIAGRVKDFEGDFLFINDANLGGRKSNLYVTQEVEQEVLVEDHNFIVKTLTITYKNPVRQDGWLNSILPNWVRIYVPKESELISLDGLEEKVPPYEEFGKKVFAGFFQLRPQGIAKVIVKYKIPNGFDGEYKLYIQKQPGKDAPLYTIKVGKAHEEFYLRTDKEMNFKL